MFFSQKRKVNRFSGYCHYHSLKFITCWVSVERKECVTIEKLYLIKASLKLSNCIHSWIFHLLTYQKLIKHHKVGGSFKILPNIFSQLLNIEGLLLWLINNFFSHFCDKDHEKVLWAIILNQLLYKMYHHASGLDNGQFVPLSRCKCWV